MLSKTSQYGIKAVLHIAHCSQNGQRVGVPDIAKAIDAPQHFTGKIVQTLAKAKILNSIKGPKGGFEMSEKQRETHNIRSIVETLDGPDLYVNCVLGLHKCNDKKPCPVHNSYGPIRQEIQKMHTASTIGELAKNLDEDVFLK